MNEIIEDLKKGSKREMECIKSISNRNTTTSEGFHPQCKFCRKKYYNEKLVKIEKYYLDNRDWKKKYYLRNCYKISIRHKEYIRNKIKTDVKFRLIFITRRKNHHALNGKSKLSSTLDILGIEVKNLSKMD